MATINEHHQLTSTLFGAPRRIRSRVWVQFLLVSKDLFILLLLLLLMALSLALSQENSSSLISSLITLI